MHPAPSAPARLRLTVRRVFRGLTASAFVAGFLGLLAVPGFGQSGPAAQGTQPAQGTQKVDRSWTPPEVGSLPDDPHGRAARRGRDLFTATYAHIGPDVTDPAKRYAGNNLACANCHLQAGTKRFGLPVYGLRDDFPEYSARHGTEISLEDRLNSCMTRSMNGRALPDDSTEMQDLVAYIKFLSTGLPAGEHLTGYGSGNMRELNRAADPELGKAVYARACLFCHGGKGEGIPRSGAPTDLGFLVPPLWGAGSFNNGAGMNRLITAANFVHFNMPHGTDYLNPQLTVDEAWDVAAYMLSQPRPDKSGLEKDFPDPLLKPVDTPYGPYADGFTEKQHKYGPFAPIRAAIEKLRGEQPGGAKKP